MGVFEDLRTRAALLLLGNKRLQPQPVSRVTSYEGTRRALSTRRAELKLTETGLAQAASLSVWAARCLNVRSSAVARADWYVKIKGTDARVEGETAFDRAMLYAFSEFRQNLMYNTEMALTIWGEAYLEPLSVGQTSIPGGLRWLNNLTVKQEIMNGRLQYYEVTGSGGRTTYFKPGELFTMHYASALSDFYGMPPMVQALEAVNVSRKTIRYIQSFYDNDASPGGVLTARAGTTIRKEDEERIIKQWQAQLKGAENAFSLALLPHALEFKSYDSKPPENQPELNEEQRREICGALSTPMAMVDAAGVSDPLSAGSTLGAQQISWLENWFVPEIEMIGDWWNAEIMPWLMPGYELGVATEGLLMAARQNADYSNMQNTRLQTGGMSVNEWRKSQNLPEKDGWDVHFIPAGVTPVHENDAMGLLAIAERQSMTLGGGMGAPAMLPPPEGSTQVSTSDARPDLPPTSATLPDLPPRLPAPLRALERFVGVDLSPPLTARTEAQRGVKWLSERGRVAPLVAVSLAAGETLTPERTRRLYDFFKRAGAPDRTAGWLPDHPDFPSAARVQWALHGGDAGQAWAAARYKSILASLERNKAVTHGSPGGTVTLWLDTPSRLLEDIRAAVRVMIGDDILAGADVAFTPDHEWHITLAQSGFVGGAEELAIIEFLQTRPEIIPPIIEIDGLAVFEKDEYNVIYARAVPAADLLALQAEVYRQWEQAGVVMSDYSVPGDWQAHITIAYLDKGITLPAALLDLPMTYTLATAGVGFNRSTYSAGTTIGITGSYINRGNVQIMTVIKQAIEQELETWERYEVKRAGKANTRPFEARAIPSALALDIAAELEHTNDRQTIQAIFKAARHLLAHGTEAAGELGTRAEAIKQATIDEGALTLLLERLEELGMDDLLSQVEDITGESTNG